MSDISADITAMVEVMRNDRKYGPYRMTLPIEKVREINPQLAADLEAAGPGAVVEISTDVQGQLVKIFVDLPPKV